MPYERGKRFRDEALVTITYDESLALAELLGNLPSEVVEGLEREYKTLLALNRRTYAALARSDPTW
jgi:hypothetical protein